jgi:hypothetical protein
VFSGTLTAPTVNATTTLQIGGVGTNTLYASKPWVQCVVNAGGGISERFVSRKSESDYYENIWTSSRRFGHYFYGTSKQF